MQGYLWKGWEGEREAWESIIKYYELHEITCFANIIWSVNIIYTSTWLLKPFVHTLLNSQHAYPRGYLAMKKIKVQFDFWRTQLTNLTMNLPNKHNPRKNSFI